MDLTPEFRSARRTMLGSVALGVVATVVASVVGAEREAALIGWDAAAIAFCTWVWSTVWSMDAAATRAHAVRDDPGRAGVGLVLLGAAVASLVAVGVVLFGAGHARGDTEYYEAGFALASIFVSWTLVHTVFTLRYAEHWYSDPAGGIDFNSDEDPDYSDFAYLSFTIGMTFQVSDTNIETKAIRRTALRHALFSFPLGAVIIAASINLVSGLAK
jgi:uncharacterized membrane protein